MQRTWGLHLHVAHTYIYLFLIYLLMYTFIRARVYECFFDRIWLGFGCFTQCRGLGGAIGSRRELRGSEGFSPKPKC